MFISKKKFEEKINDRLNEEFMKGFTEGKKRTEANVRNRNIVMRDILAAFAHIGVMVTTMSTFKKKAEREQAAKEITDNIDKLATELNKLMDM